MHIEEYSNRSARLQIDDIITAENFYGDRRARTISTKELSTKEKNISKTNYEIHVLKYYDFTPLIFGQSRVSIIYVLYCVNAVRWHRRLIRFERQIQQ